MSKKKNSTSSVNTEINDAEIVTTETIEVVEVKDVVSDEIVETEDKAETISQKTEPSKEIKFSIAKEQGKVIGITQTTVTLLLKNGTQKVIKKPNYPVKLRDMIDTTI